MTIHNATVFLRKHYVLALCILGSMVRLLYGYVYTPWLRAPDHIAWDILLGLGGLKYDLLVYYPHEGGSILISLIARFAGLFTNISALAVCAALLDFVSRYIQVYVTQKVLGDKVALLFGTWTVFAAPVILPWGVVNFGLHSISSFFPFMLLYLLWLDKPSTRFYILCGIFLGLSFWFSYSNYVLIVVFFLFHLFGKTRFRALFYALPSLLIILLVHVWVRWVADPGFHLEEIDITSIRNTEFMFSDPETWEWIRYVWTNALAQSFVAHPDPVTFTIWLKRTWIVLFFLGMSGCLWLFIQRTYPWKISVHLLTILLFVTVYAISPFCYTYETFGHYMSYRHLTYIMPFIALFILLGLSAFKWGPLPAVIFLCIGVGAAGMLFRQKPSEDTAVKAAGWALAIKMGHEPGVVCQAISSTRYDRSSLVQGMGWGMSTALFNNVPEEEVAPRIERLEAMISSYPEEWKQDLLEGIKFSFSDDVTPRLNKEILSEVLDSTAVE